MWAIIGGSGFEKFAGFEVIEALPSDTPFGRCSSGLTKVRVAGQTAIFLSRHGAHHELLPSEINYRANVYALKSAGARAVVTFSAVGSLRSELEPGHLVIPLQFIDRTKGLRKHTFCGDGVVGHMSLAHPVCQTLAEKTHALAMGEGLTSHLGGTYVSIEGPNFSTFAESLLYREMGANIVGMTAFPEYALAREAGLTYLPGCFVTDYDCWDRSRPHVMLENVLTVMRENNAKAFVLLKILLQTLDLLSQCDCANQGLKTGLFSSREGLSAEQRKWLEVLTDGR